MERKPLSLELLPMDGPGARAVPRSGVLPTTPSAALASEPEPLVPEQAPGKPLDRFLVEAMHQFKEGHVDQPLWVRALEQAGDDKERATVTYLQARATALRVIDRELRAKQREVAALLPNPSSEPPAAEAAAAGSNRSRRGRARSNLRRYGTAIGATLFSLVVCVWAFDAFRTSGTPVAAIAAAPATPAVKMSKPAQPPASSLLTSVPAQNGPTKEFLARVQELQDAGNWNVLVLYASEWTRKEPSNAAAWNQLSQGYANLRQYADARDAAMTALKITPNDPRGWRNLAQRNLDLDAPEEALYAFEQAAAADASDGYSLVQSGVLHVQLGQFAQARLALDKAIALKPEDRDALCLKALLGARQNAPKGSKAAATGGKPGSGRCGELADTRQVTVAAEK